VNNPKSKGRLVPLDIESIIPLEVEEWFGDFNWPVTWNEFIKIEQEVKDILNDHIKNFPKLAEVIVINYKLHIEYANYVFGLLLLEKLGNQVAISPNNEYFKSLFNHGVPKPIIAFPNLDSYKHGLKALMRKVKLYLEDNKFRIPKFWKKPVFIFRESRSAHTLEYLQEHHMGNFYPVSFFDFYKSSNTKALTEEINGELEELVNSINNKLTVLLESYHVQTNREQQNFIYQHTLELFRKTLVALLAVKKGLGKKKIRLFIGSNNNYYSRILSVAVRGVGGEVHGFKHGEPINYMFGLVSWLDLSLNDYYYDYTRDNVEIMKEIIRKFPPLNNNPVEIRSMESKRYEKFLEKTVKVEPDEIKKVMLIGNCFRNTSFSSATAIFPTIQLYTELEIIKKLKGEGYQVVYKLHPENLDKKIGFVKDLSVFEALFPKDVEINTERFEDTIAQVDAFAFYYTGTSTFGGAITSQKPIWFFDVHTRDYPEKMMEFISDRCIYQPTELNFIK
jgi:hypothetical protein